MTSLFRLFPVVSFKRSFPVLFILLYVQSGARGQTVGVPDWKWQNPLPTGNTLNDVQFLDAETGWAIGEKGTVLKTSDGGIHWFLQFSATTNSLNALHFSNAQSGLAVGANGTILKTSNGGLNWNIQASGTLNSLNSIFFLDAQTGWIVGENGILLKTSDAGDTWITQTSGTNRSIHSVYFIDHLNGWVVGEFGLIRKTTNGGATWTSQNSGPHPVFSSVFFTNADTGYVVSDEGNIFKTSDGGTSWVTLNFGSPHFFYSIHFFDLNTGWIVGDNGTILKTSNGGDSWEMQNTGIPNYLKSVHFINAQNGVAVGFGGMILKTTDGGLSWIRQGKGLNNQLRSVHFSDVQNGCSVGTLGTILKTSDGGNNWTIQASGTSRNLNAVHFSDSQHGWVIGEGGTILNTTNGGINWMKQQFDSTIVYYSVYFSNAQVGWIVGGDGTILTTSNGGINWSNQISGTGYILNSVHFINTQTGWAAGGQGKIIKTTNGGINWVEQNSGTLSFIKNIHFSDSQNGWATGENIVLRTTNSGFTWDSITNILSRTSFFYDTQNGWVVSLSGNILKTTNNGASWGLQNSGTNVGGRSVFFTDPLHGWVVGDNGMILTAIKGDTIPEETPVSLIKGDMFVKAESNCDPTTIPVSYHLVKATPGPFYSISDNQGAFNLRLPLADTSAAFKLVALEKQCQAFIEAVACPPNNQYIINLDTIPDTISGNDFGFEIKQCHHLDVQISSNRRRYCFKNLTIVSFFNNGVLDAPDAFILVEFPHWVRPVSSTRSFVALNDSVWRFNLGTVSAGETGRFTIIDSVLCSHPEIIGLSQCTKATIYPAPDCPSPNWNGASISTSGKCLGNSVIQLGIFNRTASNMTDSTDYKVYIDSILVKQAKVKLFAGDSLILNVSANGSGVHLVASQVAFHPTEIYSTTTVESCSLLPGSGISRTLSTRFPFSQSPGSKTHCLEIRGSYDPNDKTVIPRGFTNQNIIPPNTELEYLVRFQNTGTDTAFTVYVIDTLDQNLNVESLELGASSHPYQISLQTTKSGKTFIRWQFDNILLPDSNTNELRSHGFVQYRISPKPGLALGSKVRNHAEIYFDFNPPVITNQTLTTFDNVTYTDPSLNNNVTVLVPTGVPASVRKRMRLYPNPVTTSQLKIHFEDAGRLTLFDAQGKEVWHSVSLQGDQTIPVHLRKGMYLARIVSATHSWTEKVVVE